MCERTISLLQPFILQPPRSLLPFPVYIGVLALRQHVLDMFKPGVKLSAVFQSAKSFLNENHPTLESSLVDNLGFGLGLEFRERQLLISAENHLVAEPGMTFNLSFGLENISNPQAKTDNVYAVLVC
jgi:FACT complex subunit SPT16